MELLELIQTLNAAHGPSGDEGGIREKLAELARPLADEISTDAMGNLIVRKLGSGPGPPSISGAAGSPPP